VDHQDADALGTARDLAAPQPGAIAGESAPDEPALADTTMGDTASGDAGDAPPSEDLIDMTDGDDAP